METGMHTKDNFLKTIYDKIRFFSLYNYFCSHISQNGVRFFNRFLSGMFWSSVIFCFIGVVLQLIHVNISFSFNIFSHIKINLFNLIALVWNFAAIAFAIIIFLNGILEQKKFGISVNKFVKCILGNGKISQILVYILLQLILMLFFYFCSCYYIVCGLAAGSIIIMMGLIISVLGITSESVTRLVLKLYEYEKIFNDNNHNEIWNFNGIACIWNSDLYLDDKTKEIKEIFTGMIEKYFCDYKDENVIDMNYVFEYLYKRLIPLIDAYETGDRNIKNKIEEIIKHFTALISKYYLEENRKEDKALYITLLTAVYSALMNRTQKEIGCYIRNVLLENEISQELQYISLWSYVGYCTVVESDGNMMQDMQAINSFRTIQIGNSIDDVIDIFLYVWNALKIDRTLISKNLIYWREELEKGLYTDDVPEENYTLLYIRQMKNRHRI